MRRIYFSLFFLLLSICIFAQQQTIVQMEKEDGVYKIPCVVNGLKLKMIFDTGASNVCLSESVAQMMLENDYLSINDIKGKAKSQVADGRLVDHTKIILEKVEIGGKVLSNVEAIVVHGQAAPLLLGQSAISKLGKVSIIDNKLIINQYKIDTPNRSDYTDEQIEEFINRAITFYDEENYEIAADNYKVAYENDRLSNYGILQYADCLRFLHQTEDALNLYISLYDWSDGLSNIDKSWYYFSLQICYFTVDDYSESIKFGQLALHLADYSSSAYTSIVGTICRAYKKSGNNYKASSFAESQVTKYLDFMEIKATDAWDKGYRDNQLADLYFYEYLYTEDLDKSKKYLSLSAAWGLKEAIETCIKYDIKYLTKPSNYEY